jgi:hypothetical protein
MKLHVRVTDENGSAYEGHIELVDEKRIKSRAPRPRRPVEKEPPTQEIDFSLPERAFIKTHSKGLSGQKKFVLLLAYLVEGKIGAEVLLSDIQSHWNKMTSHLGEFNRAHSLRAKDSGWVDTKRKGAYFLCQRWKEAIEPT